MPNNRKQKKLRGKKWAKFSLFKGRRELIDLPCYTLEFNEDEDAYFSITSEESSTNPWIIVGDDFDMKPIN